MAPPAPIRRALALSVAGSLLAHGLVLFAVSRARSPAASPPPRRHIVLVDIDTPPPAPKAADPARVHTPTPRPPPPPKRLAHRRQPANKPAKHKAPSHRTHARAPRPAPPRQTAARARADGGAAATAAGGPPDAGIPLGAVAMAAAAAAGGEAAARAAVGSPFQLAGTGSDGGVASVATLGLPGAGAAAPPPGSAADLRPYAPPGDRIEVLMRLDRLRGTEWESRARDILAPMPDYRTIVGNRDVALSALFDLLLITSPHPSDVTATTLVARTAAGSATSVKAFLDRPGTPIRWSARWGGQLGRRLGAIAARDPRVYFVPLPHWMVLARPDALAGGVGDGGTAPWLANLPSLAAEAGAGEQGPAIVVSAHDLPPEVSVPQVGTVPCPRHVALAFEVAEAGFIIRGTLAFAGAARARRFVDTLRQARSSILGSLTGKLLLGQFHAYNAVTGLSLRRRDRLVTYATSISIADGRAMMKIAAAWSRRFFLRAPPRGAK